jgi:hypothetical protein
MLAPSEVFQSQKFARRVPGLATIGYDRHLSVRDWLRF